MNQERIAAREDTVIATLTDQGLIRVSGKDAATFLHNLLTNDILQLPEGQARFAGFCTAQGRLIATLTVWRNGDDFLLLVSADILHNLLKKLSMFIFRSQVKLSEVSNRVLIGLSGSETSFPCVMPDEGQILQWGERRLCVTPSVAESVITVDCSVWAWLDIAAGRPRIVAATQEMFIPQMVNMELPPLDGVSFKKGCYPGQEVIARTQYLGKVKRRMVRAKLDKELPAGTNVFTPESGEQHCGALVNIAPSPEGGFECLVVVQVSGFEAGEVHVGAPNGPQLSFLPLPYPIQ
ncbi:MAG: folate-binding protein YgfZ [Rhodocyclaceae bacterium]|nr:folate-binding protein YgfZ [Rhodocyclaceae bacterium]